MLLLDDLDLFLIGFLLLLLLLLLEEEDLFLIVFLLCFLSLLLLRLLEILLFLPLEELERLRERELREELGECLLLLSPLPLLD